MTHKEFNEFADQNLHIEYQNDDDYFYFRNPLLPWYAKDEGNCKRFDKAIMRRLTPGELLVEINQGVDVEHLTRVTGYFTKVSQWNKGKVGELKDRYRSGI